MNEQQPWQPFPNEWTNKMGEMKIRIAFDLSPNVINTVHTHGPWNIPWWNIWTTVAAIDGDAAPAQRHNQFDCIFDWQSKAIHSTMHSYLHPTSSFHLICTCTPLRLKWNCDRSLDVRHRSRLPCMKVAKAKEKQKSDTHTAQGERDGIRKLRIHVSIDFECSPHYMSQCETK